jgi:hypothetical protein
VRQIVVFFFMALERTAIARVVAKEGMRKETPFGE